MGLKTWKNAPDGKIIKTDVTVSKNYLEQNELSNLNDIVNKYLVYAENQAEKNKLIGVGLLLCLGLSLTFTPNVGINFADVCFKRATSCSDEFHTHSVTRLKTPYSDFKQ